MVHKNGTDYHNTTMASENDANCYIIHLYGGFYDKAHCFVNEMFGRRDVVGPNTGLRLDFIILALYDSIKMHNLDRATAAVLLKREPHLAKLANDFYHFFDMHDEKTQRAVWNFFDHHRNLLHSIGSIYRESRSDSDSDSDSENEELVICVTTPVDVDQEYVFVEHSNRADAQMAPNPKPWYRWLI